MSDTIGGIESISVDGLVLPVGDTVSYNFDPISVETTVGRVAGSGGRVESRRPLHVEVEILTIPDLDIAALTGAKDVSVLCQFKNGQVGRLRHAHRAGDPPDIDAAGGKFTIRFESLEGGYL